MSHRQCMVFPGTYHDSVALMQISMTLERLPGVQQAAMIMGTAQNKDLLREAGLLTPEGEQATANDLIICVQGETPTSVAEALQEATKLLHTRRAMTVEVGEAAPRTLEAALRHLPEANLALISVPGQYARYEAIKAVRHGLHVFLFSDHVELETEEELKQLATQQGVLVMGPDCGTAILNGVPLGFANQILRGPVGLISASGTGLQQVTCLLAHQGIGISQAIGVGGRDLHQRIRGRSMRAALQVLAQDPETRVIVLLSKPPAPEVASCLIAEAIQAGKPCVLAFLGVGSPVRMSPPLYPVSTLEEAALVTGALVRGEPLSALSYNIPESLQPAVQKARSVLQPVQRSIRALYGGGTLAYEALWLLRHSGGEVSSNLDHSLQNVEKGHIVLDLGAEEFTTGRPHPIIDPTVRRRQLLNIAQQPEVAVVLCDIVLGWGAHQDPATALAETWKEVQTISQAAGRSLIGIAMVCGTSTDPQGYENQCQILRDQGWIVTSSNAQAVRLAMAITGVKEKSTPVEDFSQQEVSLDPLAEPKSPPGMAERLPALFSEGPRVINIGLSWFTESLAAHTIPFVHVDWRPPAGGNSHLLGLLERLR